MSVIPSAEFISPQVSYFLRTNRVRVKTQAGIWNWPCFFTFNFFTLNIVIPNLLIVGQYQDHIFFIYSSYILNFTCIANSANTVTCFLYQTTIYSSLTCFLFLSSIQKCCRNSSVRSEKQHHLS